ncbi:hypothetical protein A3Q56_01150 [Intoshia linei]|uniref:Uncharacterized protein n=1 Tax=Intoshia linei TaxID=1819745 RepID=A0A177BA75_9BILA|nr:hypothetical protein A3Q56_01150 [Intoshia linei]
MSVCITCSLGYELDTCKACSENCLACTLVNKCDLCAVNYFLEVSFDQTTCTKCMTNCIVCAEATKCIECANGFFFDITTNKCEVCITGCSKCTDNKSCLRCMEKNMFFDSILLECKSCINNCTTCVDAKTCISCSDKFLYDNKHQICLQCPNNCILCNLETGCQTCSSGYLYNSVTKGSCGHNCKECFNSNTCKICSDDAYKDTIVIPHICTKCTDKITDCLKCYLGYDNKVYCDKCESPKILTYDSSQCLDCQTGCNSCADYKPRCTTCNKGYFLGNNNYTCGKKRCYQCHPSIMNCTKDTANMTLNVCSGDCYIERLNDMNTNVLKYKRYCDFNVCNTLNFKKKFCVNISNKESCISCCDQDICNYDIISNAFWMKCYSKICYFCNMNKENLKKKYLTASTKKELIRLFDEHKGSTQCFLASKHNVYNNY